MAYNHEHFGPYDESCYAESRQFTGTGFVYRAYVRSRKTGRLVEACGHRHRKGVEATKCAERLLSILARSTEGEKCPMCGGTRMRPRHFVMWEEKNDG